MPFRTIEKIGHFLFLFVSILLAIWLSFFPGFTRYSAIIIYILLASLMISVFADLRKAKAFFTDRISVFLWIYVFILSVGTFLAVDKRMALSGYINYALPIPILYFLFKKNFILVKDRPIFFAAICSLGSLVSIIAIIEFIERNRNLHYSYHRVSSTQLSPVVLATYLIICLIASFYLFANKNLKIRFFAGIGVILMLLGIMISLTRMAVVALAVFLFFYFLKFNKKILILVLIIMVSFVGLFTLNKNIGNISKLGIHGFMDSDTYIYRKSRAEIAFKMLKDYPSFGVGMYNSRSLFNKYGNERSESYYKVPENMFLMILIESGLTGFLSFVIFVILLLKKAFGLIGRKVEGYRLVYVLTASIIALLILMLTYDALYWTVPFYIFWVYCGMLASLVSAYKDAQETFCNGTDL